MTQPLFHCDDDLAALATLSGLPEQQHRWPALLSEMLDVIHYALVRDGLSDEAAGRQSRVALLALARHFGGSTFYLPAGDSLSRALRDDEIFSQCGRMSAADLAKLHKITLQRVYQIVGEQLALRHRSIQPDLFAVTVQNATGA